MMSKKLVGNQDGFFSEVQGFEPDEDIISIIYEKEPKRVYQESVTTAISRGKYGLSSQHFRIAQLPTQRNSTAPRTEELIERNTLERTYNKIENMLRK